MIITSEKDLRVQCVDCELELGIQIVKLLESDLTASARSGLPGIGLSAPQIGISKNVAIIRIDEKYKVDLVNPKIINKYDKFIFETEGCLSFPGRYEKTIRYNEIHVKNDIEPKEFVCTGLFAVVIQHEIDHLSGRLLPDFGLKQIETSIVTKQKPNDLCLCGSGKKYKKCHSKA